MRKSKNYINKNINKSYKSKGQNFLICQKTINKIKDIITNENIEKILIIGIGFGSILKVVPKDISRTIVEIENDLVKLNIQNQNIQKEDTVINKDILKCIPSLNVSQDTYILSNLPYCITKPLMYKLISIYGAKISKMILIIQYEVYESITNKNNAFGAFISTFFDCTPIKYIDRKCCFPSPKVDSQLIVLTNKYKSNISHYNYYNFLKCLYQSKRKVIANNKNIIVSDILSEYINLRPHEIDVNILYKLYASSRYNK